MTTISTYALMNAPRIAQTQVQATLATDQIELSSGHLADIGAGLGGNTSLYMALNAQRSRLAALTSDNSTTSTVLSTTVTSLDSIRATASAFLSSLTGANSLGSSQGSLVTSATENLSTLLSNLNTTVAGQAVFGGINSATPPMTAYAPGSSTKAAVDNAFQTAFGTSQSSAAASSITGTQMSAFLSGSFATLFDPSSFKGTWSSASDQVTTSQVSPTQSVTSSVSANDAPFRQLAQAYTMVQEFGGTNFGSDAGQAVISAARSLVSAALDGLTSIETSVGQAQSTLSDANTSMSTQMDYLSTQTSDMIAVDPTRLSTNLTSLQTQLQASYEVTSQLQQLSLVNFLK